MRAATGGALTAALIALQLVALSGQAPPAAPAPAPRAQPWPDSATLTARRVAAEQRPLFSSDVPLTFTLSADFKAVNKDRDPKSSRTFPATLTATGRDGTPVTIPVRIRTRGHSRRLQRTCSFAPLRIEFDAGRAAGTVFEGHRSLKLGTHCRDNDLFEQYVPREYAAYRIFNLMTPRSFRARLADGHYVDTVSGKTLATRRGLFIEDDDDVARRLEGRSTNIRVTFASADLETTTLFLLFEYMIGNTDLSLLAQHNVRVVETFGGSIYPVPYDFDYSGLVNAQYAIPAKLLNLTSVRERLYRGPCRTETQFKPFFARMQAVRDHVLALYDTIPGLDNGYRKDAQRYLRQFYETTESPGKSKAAFIDGCNGRAGM